MTNANSRMHLGNVTSYICSNNADLHGNGYVQYKRALQPASNNGHNAIRRLIEAHYKSGIAGVQYYE
ncbi:hypothetical protein K469DRAFT_719384 [Zopfia rhizophila CBS 207.26]|uniref:Uncharacterized protein n=1 Tax=Zopfia rhizophila CBS 207.26 TaxID=1314779 RepID=A0A6A6DHI0_9PEZI|nr:hypothetical protein K469DRAFT_719384 [Zopfia rhizophila CBS 207.26]